MIGPPLARRNPISTAQAHVRARAHSLATPQSHPFPHLNLHSARICRTRRRLPSSRCIESAQPHPARERILPARASDTALGLPGTSRTEPVSEQL